VLITNAASAVTTTAKRLMPAIALLVPPTTVSCGKPASIDG
jgi:hypothetical protein